MANILAIDDEIPILELIKNGLQKDGHTVSAYPSVSQIPLENKFMRLYSALTETAIIQQFLHT